MVTFTTKAVILDETEPTFNRTQSSRIKLSPSRHTSNKMKPSQHLPSLPRTQKAQNPANKNLVEAIIQSKVYQEYEKAFTEATGLPVSLRPVDSWHLPHRNRENENPFCAIMAEKSSTCSACLQVQLKLAETTIDKPQTVICAFGLNDTAVPVRLGDRVIGLLQTGQIFYKKPTEAQFEKVVKQVGNGDIKRDELKEAYFEGKVFPKEQYQSVVKLLNIFAEHLSMVSNQTVVQQTNSEPPMIVKAKEYILNHHGDDISLGQVATASHTSIFYFCKLFKKATGINFTEYLSRVRIEKAKNLLLNPNLRISEIAYEVGFQSLTHFNRVFKKLLGQAPTEYRLKLSPQ